MRIVKALIVAIALLGIGITSAHAQETVTVQKRSSAPAIVLRDTIAGGLVGSAVSGGIILYNMGIQDKSDYNWQKTLAWGAVIGLGAGLVWGLVDATTGPTYAAATPPPREPVRDGRSVSLDVTPRDQSGTQLFGLYARRF